MSLQQAEMEALSDELYEKCDRLERELAAMTAELDRKSDAIQRLWKDRDELRAELAQWRDTTALQALDDGLWFRAQTDKRG